MNRLGEGDGVLVGDDMEIRMVRITDLREQDINAQVQQPRQMERLTENVRERKALESLPYCAVGEKGVEIVSGHHRVKAARAAGLDVIPVLVDLKAMTRSQVRSKQIAHNELVGTTDDQILAKMLQEINDVNDLLATGLPEEKLPIPEIDTSPLLSSPHASFDWRTAAITFLPHQLEDFKAVVEHLDGQVDYVGVAPVEVFDDFARYLAQFARFREIRSVGTTVAVLTRIARDQVELMQDSPDDEEWVKLESVVGIDAMPAPAAKIVQQAISKRMQREGLEDNPWRALEAWAAEEIAS